MNSQNLKQLNYSFLPQPLYIPSRLILAMAQTLSIQPTINMGIVGHVDHGKTTLTKLLSGKWTDTHSEEIKRGITIKLGYTNFTIHKKGNEYSVKADKGFEPVKKVSIVDAPGHESFMATMISGSAVMDCALLVVAANEKVPQPQTIEHLKTLEIAGIQNVIIVQNKIDLVSKEEALKNFQDTKKFLEGTFAEDAPIIPISAQHGANISELIRYIFTNFIDPKRNTDTKPLMSIVRSFDINKPGADYSELQGGVLGGSLKEGTLTVGDEIEVRPGLMEVKGGRVHCTPITAKVEALKSDKDSLDAAVPGGSVAIMTKLDPSLTKSDSLVGQIAGLKGQLPEPANELSFSIHLLDKVITSSEEYEVKPIILNEPLMMIVNSLTTVGTISKANPREATIKLKRPVMAFKDDRAVIFRKFEGNKWRIVGYGIVQ